MVSCQPSRPLSYLPTSACSFLPTASAFREIGPVQAGDTIHVGPRRGEDGGPRHVRRNTPVGPAREMPRGSGLQTAARTCSYAAEDNGCPSG